MTSLTAIWFVGHLFSKLIVCLYLLAVALGITFLPNCIKCIGLLCYSSLRQLLFLRRWMCLLKWWCYWISSRSTCLIASYGCSSIYHGIQKSALILGKMKTIRTSVFMLQCNILFQWFKMRCTCVTFLTDHNCGFCCLQLKEYKVVGRMMPTAKMRMPPIYQMRIFACDQPQAKSRFWYYASMLRKVKKTQGEILCCSQVAHIVSLVMWHLFDVDVKFGFVLSGLHLYSSCVSGIYRDVRTLRTWDTSEPRHFGTICLVPKCLTFLHWCQNVQWTLRHWCRTVLYSLTETETEMEIYIFSLSEVEMETEMFCKTETKYKCKSESIKRNSNWNEIDFTTKMITQNVFKNLASHYFHLVIWWQLTTFNYDTSKSLPVSLSQF